MFFFRVIATILFMTKLVLQMLFIFIHSQGVFSYNIVPILMPYIGIFVVRAFNPAFLEPGALIINALFECSMPHFNVALGKQECLVLVFYNYYLFVLKLKEREKLNFNNRTNEQMMFAITGSKA